MRRYLTVLIVALACGLGLATPCAASWALVTSGYGNADTASQTVTVTLTLGGGSGHVAACGIVFTGTTLSTVGDGTNTWTIPALSQGDGTFTLKVAYQASNLPAGSTTITATFADSLGTFKEIGCAEYSGLATSSAFDVSGSNRQAAPGTGTNAVTTGNITTAANNELAWGFMFARSCSGCTIDPGTSPITYTERSGQPDLTFYNVDMEDGNAATAGTNSATWTLGTDKDSSSAILTFKEPVAGGSTPPTLTLTGVGGPGDQ